MAQVLVLARSVRGIGINCTPARTINDIRGNMILTAALVEEQPCLLIIIGLLAMVLSDLLLHPKAQGEGCSIFSTTERSRSGHGEIRAQSRISSQQKTTSIFLK